MICKLLICLGLITSCACLAHPLAPYLDVYTTEQITAQQIIDRLHTPLEDLFQSLRKSAWGQGNQRARRHWQRTQQHMTAVLHTMGDFLEIQFSPVFYKGHEVYITLDIIDDPKRLHHFKEQPDATHADPGDLLASWQRYNDAYMRLLKRGHTPTLYTCPYHHCLSNPHDPRTAPYFRLFEQQVPQHAQALQTILYRDADPHHRATAAFLLGHIQDGQHLVQLLLPAVHDPHVSVRNNVMRVIAYALYHVPMDEVPLEPFLEALDFPRATDRNKALAVISQLVRHPQHAQALRRSALPQLLRLLHMHQPNSRDLAHSILMHLSGHTWPHDDAAWTQWVAKHRP